MSDDAFVYINIVYIDVLKHLFFSYNFYLEYEMYTPRAHLITGALSDPTININSENSINTIIIVVLMAD